MMLRYTGMGAGEVWSLPLKNIDLKGEYIVLREVPELDWKPKKGKEAQIPIVGRLKEFLLEDLKKRGSAERLKDAKTKVRKGHFDKAGWNGKVLVIDGESVDEGFKKAAGNLPGVNVMPAMGANVYDILNHDTLVLTKEAVEKLEARFNG